MKNKKLLMACLLLLFLTFLFPASPANKAASDEGMRICNDMPPIDSV